MRQKERLARSKAYAATVGSIGREYGEDALVDKPADFQEGIFNAGWEEGKRYARAKSRSARRKGFDSDTGR
jgi:hypothetical protein